MRVIRIILSSLLLINLFYCTIGKEGDALQDVSSAVYSNWQHYLGDPGRSHFSTLTQLDTTNVSQLEIAWIYKSGGLSEGRSTQMQTNPLIVGNMLFGVNAAMTLFAINAETGSLIWEFVPPVKDGTGLGVSRGIVYWQGSDDKETRLLFTSGSRLYAVDPLKGTLITSFGTEGGVDLREGLGRDPEKLFVVGNTPGTIYQDKLILGTRVHESYGAAPGHIRAYDVRTGKIAWTFRTIPQPGDLGYDTWPADAYLTTGGANNWSGSSLDEERGIIYIPTGSAAFDYYGGDRIGANLFANTLLALRAESGERLWHYQLVHHDIWDRDLPAPSNLLHVKQHGKIIPAVAQVTKSGHVFLFNRESGEPLFPVEEKEYPASPLPGEMAFTTQPLPVKPKPFARQQLTQDDLYAPQRLAYVDDFIDKDQNISPPTVLEKFKSITSGGQFVPIDTNGVIVFPGLDGGAEWGGAAVDPRSGILYVNSNEMPWILRLKKINDGGVSGSSLLQIHCVRCHGGSMQGSGDAPELQHIKTRLSTATMVDIIKKGKGAMPAMPNLSQNEISMIVDYLTGKEKREAGKVDRPALPYGLSGIGRFKDDRGYPVVKPPWGTLNAIDMNTGEYVWQVPLGHEETLNDIEFPVSGIENYGGPIITAGGLLFIAATKDEKFRAFNLRNGKLLWETTLPAGGYATPATYQVGKKQYVVIACGGGKMGTKSGDSYIAFALPD